MKFKEGKVFRNSKNIKNIEIIAKEYDKTKNDYYGFIKKYNSLGLRQVIITSEIMIKLIEIYTVSRRFSINEIDFMVEDYVLDDEINMYLSNIKEDRANLVYLLEHLKFLAHDDSIDIKSITLQGQSINIEKEFRVIIRVNGLFSISDYSYGDESEFLVEKISDIFND
jgi:UTP-glucose-1-phosphate uridylyltransferase